MGKPRTSSRPRKGTAKTSPQQRPLKVDGNSLTLLTEGPDRLDGLIALIDGAQHSLRLLYYMFHPDASGQRVKDALHRAMERGVEVALLIDGFGSSATPADYFTDLSDAGAKFCRFNPTYGRRYLLRNHQKLALAMAKRGSCAIVGGVNVADDYFSVDHGAWTCTSA